MSTNVADCYRMVGKGKLERGYDGDVVLVDMNHTQLLKMKIVGQEWDGVHLEVEN